MKTNVQVGSKKTEAVNSCIEHKLETWKTTIRKATPLKLHSLHSSRQNVLCEFSLALHTIRGMQIILKFASRINSINQKQQQMNWHSVICIEQYGSLCVRMCVTLQTIWYGAHQDVNERTSWVFGGFFFVSKTKTILCQTFEINNELCQ